MNLNLHLNTTFFVFTAFLLSAISSYSQNLELHQLDSLAAEMPKMKDDTAKGMLYQTLGRGYSEFDLDKAYQAGKNLENMSVRIKWENGIGIAYNILGYVSLKRNIPDSAYFFYKKANNIHKKTGNRKGYAVTYANLGNVAMHKANFPEALNYYMNGLKEFEAIKEKFNIMNLNMNIGLVFGNMKMYPQSKQYLKNALNLAMADKEEIFASKVLVNIGSIYMLENAHLDSARFFLHQAIALANRLNIEDILISANLNLASSYFKENKIDSVQKIFNSPLIKKLDPYSEQIITVTQLNTEILFQRKDASKSEISQAIPALLRADSISRAIEKNESVRELALLLSIAYEKLGNTDKSLLYYKRYHQMADSIDNSDNRQTLNNLQHQREIELKDTQIKLNALELQNQKRMQWIGAGIILAIAFIGTVFWYQNQQRKKANKLLSITNQELDESNKVKARFFSILSHDLRAPIASLSNYIYLLNEDENIMEHEIKKAHQNKIETATNNLLSTMEDILLWSKSQMEHFEPVKKNVAVAKIFDDVKMLIPEGIDIDIRFNNPDQLEIYTDENYLKTIMRNLTANALKALKGKPDGQIEWKAYEQHGKKYLSISDNGPGLSAAQKERLFTDDAVISTKTGLGLHLVRDLTKMLQHQLNVSSEQGLGTSFIINLN